MADDTNQDRPTKQVVHEIPDQFSNSEEGQEHSELDMYIDQRSSLSPAPAWDHLIFQMESDSYQESIRGGASQSLPIFVRILSSFAITGIFDPEYAHPASSPPFTDTLLPRLPSRIVTWGLPDCVTMMDASTSSTSLSSVGIGNNESQCTDELSSLVNAAPGIDTIQATQNLTEANKPWIYPSEPWSSIEYDDYALVSEEILSRLRNKISQRRPAQGLYSQERDSQLADGCFALFSPGSLMKFTDEYWSTWYIHWPVLHRATFQISPTSTALVASLVLLAASYSSEAAIRELAQYWADAVESIVFTDEYFGSSTMYSALNGACFERRLRALQAAHAMCIYQSFEGNHAARTRIRRSRFNEVVAVSRHPHGQMASSNMLVDGAGAWFPEWSAHGSSTHYRGHI